MIAVQNISCGRKLKSFLKERKSREFIEYHKVHIAETKVEFYVILTFKSEDKITLNVIYINIYTN